MRFTYAGMVAGFLLVSTGALLIVDRPAAGATLFLYLMLFGFGAIVCASMVGVEVTLAVLKGIETEKLKR